MNLVRVLRGVGPAVLAISLLGAAASEQPAPWRQSPVAAITAWRVTDLAVPSGIAAATGGVTGTQGYTCVTDVNGDGRSDLVLSQHGETTWPLLLQQPNGKFVVGHRFGPVSDYHGCISADLGSLTAEGTIGPPDGRPDFYFTTGACQGTCTQEYPNRLYLQTASGGFAELGKLAGVDDPHGRGRDAVAFDANRDGLTDLYVTNEQPSNYTEPNHLYINTGKGFTERVDPVLAVPMTVIRARSADWNGDGRTDIVACTLTHTYFYENDVNGFVDVDAQLGLSDASAFRDVTFHDLNGDGHVDLIGVAEGKFSVRLWHAGAHPYDQTSYGFSLARGQAVAVGDLFGTSDRDVFVVDGHAAGAPRQAPDWALRWTGGATFARYQMPQPADTGATTYPLDGQGDTVSIAPNWAGSGRGLAVVSNGLYGSGYYQAIFMAQAGIGHIGDTLTYQNGSGPTAITTAYQTDGWSTSSIAVDGLDGRYVYSGTRAPSSSDVLDSWKAGGYDPYDVVIALGTYDTLYSLPAYWSGAVGNLLKRLTADLPGPHRIWWVNVAGDDAVGADGAIGPKGNTVAAYNSALETKLANTGVVILDWNAYVKTHGIASWWQHDAQHERMTSQGYAARNAWLAQQVAHDAPSP